MLMPKETFIIEIGQTRSNISASELIAIKETYGISAQAIMARARDLGVLSQERYTQFWKRVNMLPDGRKELNMGQYIGREHSYRFKQLLYRATAEELISMSKAANLANKKLAEFRDEYIAL
jgi:Zn-dependent peptidase ImmA (M78 family)